MYERSLNADCCTFVVLCLSSALARTTAGTSCHTGLECSEGQLQLSPLKKMGQQQRCWLLPPGGGLTRLLEERRSLFLPLTFD